MTVYDMSVEREKRADKCPFCASTDCRGADYHWACDRIWGILSAAPRAEVTFHSDGSTVIMVDNEWENEEE